VLYRLIAAFGRATGVPLLANTSLNDKGEPIADDAVHAMNFCIRKDIPVLYVGGSRIRLRPADGGPTAPEDRCDTFVRQQADWIRLWADWQARGHSAETLFVYAHSPELRGLFPDDTDPARLDALVSRVLRMNANERTWARNRLANYGPDQTQWPPPPLADWED
jgi:hypothetical protein